MDDEEIVLEMARAIRPYLREIAGDAGRGVDRDLAALLAQATTGRKVGAEIIQLLSADPATHGWGAQFLSKGFPQTSRTLRSVLAPFRGEARRLGRVGSPAREEITCGMSDP
jgi:hypothetical protein